MVKIRNIKDLLTEAPLFDGMADHYLELLAGCGRLAHFKAGEFLLKEGEEANSFYLIRRGEVAIESHTPGGRPLTVAKVGTLGIVGYSWLFPPYRNQFDSCAVTSVDAVHLDGKCLRGKAESDHELGYQFIKRFAAIMIRRMQDARRQMLDIYGNEKAS
ncbi:MAG: Crp/Fnr family transcriptional regulator [Rickettsiales bacterium]|nr:Crp/Fnr family transcriptional regulator [Rickettsiales bacterium]